VKGGEGKRGKKSEKDRKSFGFGGGGFRGVEDVEWRRGIVVVRSGEMEILEIGSEGRNVYLGSSHSRSFHHHHDHHHHHDKHHEKNHNHPHQDLPASFSLASLIESTELHPTQSDSKLFLTFTSCPSLLFSPKPEDFEDLKRLILREKFKHRILVSGKKDGTQSGASSISYEEREKGFDWDDESIEQEERLEWVRKCVKSEWEWQRDEIPGFKESERDQREAKAIVVLGGEKEDRKQEISALGLRMGDPSKFPIPTATTPIGRGRVSEDSTPLARIEKLKPDERVGIAITTVDEGLYSSSSRSVITNYNPWTYSHIQAHSPSPSSTSTSPSLPVSRNSSKSYSSSELDYQTQIISRRQENKRSSTVTIDSSSSKTFDQENSNPNPHVGIFNLDSDSSVNVGIIDGRNRSRISTPVEGLDQSNLSNSYSSSSSFYPRSEEGSRGSSPVMKENASLRPMSRLKLSSLTTLSSVSAGSKVDRGGEGVEIDMKRSFDK
jgi:hypothetical protein